MKNSMKKWSLYFSLMLVVLTMASCKKGKNNLLTPISSGRPYEVLVAEAPVHLYPKHDTMHCPDLSTTYLQTQPAL